MVFLPMYTILTIIISAILMVWAKSCLVRLNPPNETVRSLQSIQLLC